MYILFITFAMKNYTRSLLNIEVSTTYNNRLQLSKFIM